MADRDAEIQAFMNEVIDLVTAWLLYKEIFGHSHERWRVFTNERIGWFFYRLERSLGSNVLLAIARLTDPPGSGDRISLTCLRMRDELVRQPLGELPREELIDICNRVEKIQDLALAVREHRHRYLAHLDLRTRMRERTLPDVYGHELEEIVQELRGLAVRLSEVMGWNWTLEGLSIGHDVDVLHAFVKWGIERPAAELVAEKIRIQRLPRDSSPPTDPQ